MSLTELLHPPTHIVRGSPMQQERFPFQAGILHDGSQFCGGSLIAPNVVLTAAHCAQTPASDVVLGCDDITDLSLCEVIPVVNSTVFQDFNINSYMNGDIQLLVLESDSVQQPIALASPGFDLNPGRDLTVTGWGAVDFSTQFKRGGFLLEAHVESVSQESCNSQYKDLFEFVLPAIPILFPGEIVNDFKMCSVADKQGPCQGDSGGPVFMRCDATGEDLQLGIVSFGLGCAYDGMPTVYTTVFHPDGFKFIENVVISQGHSLKTIGSTSEFCVVGGTQPAEEMSDPPTPFPTFDLASWTCDNDFFAAGNGCHCNCGIPDPDCELQNIVYGCETDELCIEGICTNHSVTPSNGIPSEWICPPTFYDDFFCDCNCGAPDPDCEPGAKLGSDIAFGCETGQKCVNDICMVSNSTNSSTIIPTSSPTLSPNNTPSGDSDDDNNLQDFLDDLFGSGTSTIAALILLSVGI